MNNDTIYKMYCDKIKMYDDYDLREYRRPAIEKTLHFQLFALRTHSWAFYMVFKGMFLKGFYKVVRFFK